MVVPPAGPERVKPTGRGHKENLFSSDVRAPPARPSINRNIMAFFARYNFAFWRGQLMSALGGKADMTYCGANVCF